jgi:hypothetical protein
VDEIVNDLAFQLKTDKKKFDEQFSRYDQGKRGQVGEMEFLNVMQQTFGMNKIDRTVLMNKYKGGSGEINYRKIGTDLDMLSGGGVAGRKSVVFKDEKPDNVLLNINS